MHEPMCPLAWSITSLNEARPSQIATAPAAMIAIAVVASSLFAKYNPPIATSVAITPVT
jgi:hypothetical protein